MNTSSRFIPLLRSAAPTSDSLPYIRAVSMWRYPIFSAYSTGRWVTWPGGDWYTPRPRRGIMTPLLSLATGSTVACIGAVDCSGSHFNLNSGVIPRGGVLGKTVHVAHAGGWFHLHLAGAALAHGGPAKVIRIYFPDPLSVWNRFGLVFLRKRCSGFVSGFSISVYSPWDQRGFSCSRNRRLGSEITADSRRLREPDGVLSHSRVARCDREDPPSPKVSRRLVRSL